MSDDLRLQTLTVQRKTDLITETCDTCGALFAMEKSIQNERVKDKNWFYCPLGHAIRYAGKSETTKLKEQLEEERRQRQRAEQNVAMWVGDAKEQRERAERERHRANGYKGHATRITRRAKAGVCPCCNRSFENLRRHMDTKHPQFTPMPLEVIEGGKADVA